MDSDAVSSRIFLFRGRRVMLSPDLAGLYEVPPKVLIQAVKRNIERFPEDFMFVLTPKEAMGSRSHFVTLKRGQNIKYAPYAFTEQGVAMLSSVLRSSRAIQVNIAIMRAFVRLREMIASHRDLARRLDVLEKKCDSKFTTVFNAIRMLMAHPKEKPRRIGFQP